MNLPQLKIRICFLFFCIKNPVNWICISKNLAHYFQVLWDSYYYNIIISLHQLTIKSSNYQTCKASHCKQYHCWLSSCQTYLCIEFSRIRIQPNSWTRTLILVWFNAGWNVHLRRAWIYKPEFYSREFYSGHFNTLSRGRAEGPHMRTAQWATYPPD